MSSSWRTRCRGSASCRRPSARRADACWRMQQMHRAANERRRHLKMFPVSGQVRAAGAGSAGSNVPGCAVAMQSVSHQREAAERQARPALLVTGRERIQAGAGARAASRAPREQRTHQRSGHLKKWRAAGSCSPSRLRGWTVKKRLLLKRKNKPIPTKLAHAGNCNQSDRRIGTRIRCARVDVPPRPLTTKASTPFLE